MSIGHTRRSDGFRERGQQVTRLETFVEAASAFALTLLLIAVGDVPDSIPAMLDALRRIPAFAGAFALLAMFRWAHNTRSRRDGLDDGPALVLSLACVFVAVIHVCPLRLLSEGLFGGALPGAIRLATIDELKAMCVVYGACFPCMGLVLAALYAHALRRRVALDLDEHETRETAGEVAARVWLAANGLFSIVAALLLPARGPSRVYALPGLVYFSMFLTGPVVRAAMRWWVRRAGPVTR